VGDASQALLRGVAAGSFPCALGPEPEVTVGLRRFVVIDENINRLYGQKIRQVRSRCAQHATPAAYGGQRPTTCATDCGLRASGSSCYQWLYRALLPSKVTAAAAAATVAG
jgi:hypothetical protein